MRRCRNGYARVLVVPAEDPGGASAHDSIEVYLQDRGGRWHGLDFGTGTGCEDDPAGEVAAACRALGYRS